MASILILYHSQQYGNTAAMAEAVAEGAQAAGAVVDRAAPVRARDAVVVAAGGVAYVDLRSAAAATPPSSGSRLEMLRVYSLVNTVLGNLVTAEKAVILWNGTQLGTFAGHLDLGRPLAFRDDLVEPPGRRS